tara:strand:- start:1917 stop:4277 length:2361 start_codon:yes stop_codon:yes gene_type:complete
MQTTPDLQKNAVVTYARFLLRWRWAAIALALVVTVVAAYGAKNLGFASDYRVFFGDDNPQLAAYEELQKVYTKDDSILIVLKPKSGDVFTPELLRGIQDLTAKAWKTPFSSRVDSLTNFQHSHAEEDDLIVEDLVQKSNPLRQSDLTQVRHIALTEPLLKHRLISPDGTTTAINITLNLPQKELTEIPSAMTYARALVEEFRIAHPDTHVALTGMVPLNSAFFEASMTDMSTLIPLMYGVLLLVTFFMLRSISGTAVTLIVIGLSAVTAMGIGGWLNIQLTPPSAVAPTVILTIAIADSIHILVTLFSAMRAGMGKYDAIVESLRVNFGPVFLTSLTTIVGFLSLNFSDSPPFGDLGNITAAGVTAAWFFSVLLLPALMAILPVRIKARAATDVTFMDKLANFVILRRRILLAGTVALVVGLGVMVPQNMLNDQFVQYFDKSVPFRADSDFTADNLSGMYQLQWSLPATEAGGVNDPVYLGKISAFSDWLRVQPGVDNVLTVSDIFKRLNKNMHGDDPAMYRMPEDRNLSAQFLLLYEMSLPYGLDLNNQINVDKSAVRLVATTENFTTNDLKALDQRASLWLKQNFSTQHLEASGPVMMFTFITERNIQSMLIGTTVALLLISLILMVALRSFKLGLISLVPNLVPVIMTFGVWAIFVGQVDVAATIVTATSLGVVVDATVHFLSKYLRAQREKNLNTEDAVRYAFANVGVALFATSLILIAGFAVLTWSTFRLNASMGQLTALAIAAALLADFLLLPALLLTIDKRRKAKASTENADPALIAAE